MKTFSVVCALFAVICVVDEAVSNPLARKTGDQDHLTIPSDDRDNYLGVPPFQPISRPRRSQRPSGNAPNPTGGKSKDRGSVSVDVHRERGVGTVVSAQGERNVWKSRDGSARVDAHGHYDRVYNGPGRSRPNYGGGVTFSKRF